MLLPLGAVKASQHLKKWKGYIYICRWTGGIHKKDRQHLGALSVKNWCWHNFLSLKSNSWFAPDHRRRQGGSIAFSNGTVQEKPYFTFFKVHCSLTLDKSLYVLCILYWNGGKIDLSNRYWSVPSTLPWSSASWDSFQELVSALQKSSKDFHVSCLYWKGILGPPALNIEVCFWSTQLFF